MKSFHEAAPQMKVGDVFKTLGGEFYELKKHGSFKVKEQDPVILTTAIFNLSGEIIRAEPEILTAEEMMKNHGIKYTGTGVNGYVEKYGEAMDLNGQIREWKRGEEHKRYTRQFYKTEQSIPAVIQDWLDQKPPWEI